LKSNKSLAFIFAVFSLLILTRGSEEEIRTRPSSLAIGSLWLLIWDSKSRQPIPRTSFITAFFGTINIKHQPEYQ